MHFSGARRSGALEPALRVSGAGRRASGDLTCVGAPLSRAAGRGAHAHAYHAGMVRAYLYVLLSLREEPLCGEYIERRLIVNGAALCCLAINLHLQPARPISKDRRTRRVGGVTAHAGEDS